jgi:Tol biopolymer transport system component/DNA-binding winged helix-turn-helix (wHTH) protein
MSEVVRFGAFTFDGDSSELRKGETRLKVPDQSLQILGALLECPGQLVSREDLRQRLWPPDTFVDFESGLNAAVRRLREALHDSADEPRFIETLPRRGYRFIGQVERLPNRRQSPTDTSKGSLDEVGEEPRYAGLEPMPAAAARWGWISMAVLVAVAGLAAVYAAWRPESPPDLSQPREVQLTTLIGSETSPTLAPDGEQVAFAWSGPNQDNPDIYVQRIGSGTELRRTVDPRWDHSPAWSPDGRWIAFLRGDVPGRNDVMLIPPLGGPERRVGEIHIRQDFVIPPYLSWLPDSRALVVVNSASPQETEALFLMSVDTGELRALTTATLSNPHQQPAVSPDGRAVAFFRRSGPLCVVRLTEDLRAAAEPSVLPARSRAVHPTWTPDGKEIVYSDGERLWRVDATGKGSPTSLSFAGRNAIMPVISRPTAGRLRRLVYVNRSADQNLWRLDLPRVAEAWSAAPTIFHSSTRTDFNAQFSPDGQRVAFQSNRSGNMEIWVGDADGKNPAQLTELGAPNTGTPRWSPDGQTIAFDSNAEGQYEIYVIAVRGGNPRRLTFEPTEDAVPSFSRDGRFLYFSSRRSGQFEIWKIPTAGGEAVRVTRNGGFAAFESVDGRYLYYTQNSNEPSSLWRVPTAGGEAERVLDGVNRRAFVPIETGIYYVEDIGRSPSEGSFAMGQGFLGQGGRARLRFFEFASATSKVVADLGERLGLGLAASPDGRAIIFTRLDSPSSDLMMIENFR